MPKARGHGSGALFETTHQGRRVWRAVIDDGFTEDGRRKQRAVQGKTKSEVQAKLARMMRERDTLGRVLDRATRFSDAAEAWLEDVSKTARLKTLSGYRSQLRVNVLPALGRNTVADLTPGDVRRMHVAIRARGSGDADVASAHRVAVSVLEW